MSKEDSTYCQVPFEFTINSANTWEKKVVTIPANDVIKASSSVVNDDNGAGVTVAFNLVMGGNYDNGTNLAWETGGASYATTNQLNFLSSTDNDLFITGVQLEVGSGASDFEHLPHDVSLERCRRYLQRIDSSGTDYGSFGSGSNANATSCIFGKQFSLTHKVALSLLFSIAFFQSEQAPSASPIFDLRIPLTAYAFFNSIFLLIAFE